MNNRLNDVTEVMVDESLKEHLKEAVRELAMERIMLIKLHVMEEDEVTEFINKYGEEFTKEFSEKNPLEILLEEVKRIGGMA